MAVLESIRNFFIPVNWAEEENVTPAPPTTYKILPLTLDDISDVLRLNLRCFRNGDNYTKYTFEYLLNEPRTLSYRVVTEAGEIVGFAFVMVKDHNAAHLTTIGVAPEHRRLPRLPEILGELLVLGFGLLDLEGPLEHHVLRDLGLVEERQHPTMGRGVALDLPRRRLADPLPRFPCCLHCRHRLSLLPGRRRRDDPVNASGRNERVTASRRAGEEQTPRRASPRALRCRRAGSLMVVPLGSCEDRRILAVTCQQRLASAWASSPSTIRRSTNSFG